MSLYHYRRGEHIDSLPADHSFPLDTLPCIDETMRKQLYGVACSASALAGRIQEKLQVWLCLLR